MGRIQNVDILTSHGHSAGRKALVEILGAGLDACDPGNNVRRLVRLDGDILTIGSPDFEPAGDPRSGEEVIDLRQVGRIFVVGAGKGVQYTAKALEDILGERLTGGHLIEKHGSPNILSRVEITFGAHPVPDEGCVEGCRRILELCADLREDDPGSSPPWATRPALLTLPVEGSAWKDVQRLVYLFQIERAGRRLTSSHPHNHLDQMKGENLRHRAPAAVSICWVELSRTYRDLMYHDLNRWLQVLPDTQTYAGAVRNPERSGMPGTARPSQ